MEEDKVVSLSEVALREYKGSIYKELCRCMEDGFIQRFVIDSTKSHTTLPIVFAIIDDDGGNIRKFGRVFVRLKSAEKKILDKIGIDSNSINAYKYGLKVVCGKHQIGRFGLI